MTQVKVAKIRKIKLVQLRDLVMREIEFSQKECSEAVNSREPVIRNIENLYDKRGEI
jgi:hypothetical protein